MKSGVRTRYEEIKVYITKDGSQIRELVHPDVQGNNNMSLAEATVPPGVQTLLHRHNRSEEVYHILDGRGLMSLGEEHFEVKPGDSIYIPPRTPHRIKNVTDCPLRFLCCCAPPYSHDDTFLL